MKSNILVIGATGKTGRKVVEILKRKQYNVRAGSRNSQPSFDWNNPDGWPAALDGIDKMYIVYYPDLAVPGAQEAIQKLMTAAKNAGVQKAVLLSGKGEVEAERCEQIVANSGLDYTLVRASWFSQNFSESFLLTPILAGHVALPMPEAKIPFVDTGDLAEVVVKALLEDQHNGKTYEITGPRTLTFKEAVDTIATGTGRTIAFQPISLDAYENQLQEAGLPGDYVWLLSYLFREVLGTDSNQVVSNDIETVLGRKATDFADYVMVTARTGVWHQSLPQSM